jgi:hypothetical protein
MTSDPRNSNDDPSTDTASLIGMPRNAGKRAHGIATHPLLRDGRRRESIGRQWAVRDGRQQAIDGWLYAATIEQRDEELWRTRLNVALGLGRDSDVRAL